MHRGKVFVDVVSSELSSVHAGFLSMIPKKIFEIFCNEQSHHCEVSEIETASFKITGFGKEKSKLKWIYTAAHRNF